MSPRVCTCMNVCTRCRAHAMLCNCQAFGAATPNSCRWTISSCVTHKQYPVPACVCHGAPQDRPPSAPPWPVESEAVLQGEAVRLTCHGLLACAPRPSLGRERQGRHTMADGNIVRLTPCLVPCWGREAVESAQLGLQLQPLML